MLVRVIGVASVVNKFGRIATDADGKAEKALETVGEASMAEIKRLAPVDTGAYRDSINMGKRKNTVIIGTSAPQGARLEFGFGGPDSLGRIFPVRPQPHFGPVADQIGGRLETELMRELGF